MSPISHGTSRLSGFGHLEGLPKAWKKKHQRDADSLDVLWGLGLRPIESIWVACSKRPKAEEEEEWQ